LSVLKAASEVIRQEDPGKPILAAGIAFAGAEFDAAGNFSGLNKKNIKVSLQQRLYTTMEKNVALLLEQGCPYFDIIDIHLYHTVESIPGRVAWIKAMMKKKNCQKPIWATEISGPQLTPAEVAQPREQFLKRQAEELPLRLNLALTCGVEKVFYFQYRVGRDKSSADILATTLGLVDEDGNKNPAYQAMQDFMKGKN